MTDTQIKILTILIALCSLIQGAYCAEIHVSSGGSIQEAVDRAKPGDTINVEAGVYKETVRIDKILSIKGEGSDKTIVDGDGKGPVFAVTNSGARVLLSGLGITGGKNVNGGGIYNVGTLSLSSCVVTGSSARFGGGVFNTGVLRVSDACKISTNKAEWHGGGIYTTGLLKVSGKSEISENTAEGMGGGIFGKVGSRSFIDSGSDISGNTAFNGGGIANKGTFSFVGGSTITGNSAGNDGGGIHNSGTFNVHGSTIFMNSAGVDCSGGSGGGIYVQSGKVSVSSCTTSKNQAGHGGGIFVYDGSFTALYGEISDNIARGDGGGIDNQAILSVRGCTISRNTAESGDGGGIYSLSMSSKSRLDISGNANIIENQATTGRGGGIFSWYDDVTLDGKGVYVKDNKAHLPAEESGWYKGWGVYTVNGKPTTRRSFDPANQVKGNTKI